jgi:hypothetical protein
MHVHSDLQPVPPQQQPSLLKLAQVMLQLVAQLMLLVLVVQSRQAATL